MFHEALSLFVDKKTEKSNLILLGQKIGLPPGFRKAIINHPGIFYVSNKLKTETVVLREGYRRHVLVEKHPVMDVRYRYVHLMHKRKPVKAKGGEKKKAAAIGDYRDSEFDDVDEYDEEEEEEEDEDEEESDDDDNVNVNDYVVKGIARSRSVGRERNARQRRTKVAS